MAHPGPDCRYRVLVLTHDATAVQGTGGNGVGYPPLDSATAGREDEALACYLYKD